MKFRNPETGEIFDTIIEALERYCQDHPQELLILMNYDEVEDEPSGNPGKLKEANMDKPLKDWTLGEALEYCKKHENCGKDGCRFADGIACKLNNPTNWDIEEQPRFTEQEVEDAKTIKRMFGADNFTHIHKDEDGWPEMMDGPGEDGNVGWCSIGMEEGMFPSLRPNETVTLDEIIGGAE